MSVISTAIERLPILRSRGIYFDEKMVGYHVLQTGPRKGERLDFMFTAAAQSETIPGFFGAGGGVIALDGEVKAEGLAAKSPMRGTIRMDPRAKVGVMTYDFDFTGDDGKPYHFHGFKNREGLVDTLYGKVLDFEGGLVSEGTTYFDYDELWKFVRSFKLV
ncbi:MAG: hypothetical protein KDH09_14670 [Chrysiogenetes bacterium]|nr:hypothetical protein [Chrysiogenetes bacterium]